MGKITVSGKEEREYEADQCNITLIVESTRETAAKASKDCSEQCEKLLSVMKKTGITPDQFELKSDKIEDDRSYSKYAPSYKSTRKIILKTVSDMKTINMVREVIETGFENISYDVSFSVSYENEIRKTLLKEAISKSRDKAEQLAESIGSRIIGIESANLNRYYPDFPTLDDLLDFKPIISPIYGREALSNELKRSRITLSEEVTITWLLE